MVLKSAPYYWLECDGCGEKSTESGDFSAWAEPDGAEEDAREWDWMIRGDGHWCEDCSAKLRCTECGEYEDTKGHLLTLVSGVCKDCLADAAKAERESVDA